MIKSNYAPLSNSHLRNDINRVNYKINFCCNSIKKTRYARTAYNGHTISIIILECGENK